jgi:hypothetical protein
MSRPTMRASGWLLFAGACVVGSACGGSDKKHGTADPVCELGARQECTCADGRDSGQDCAEDGSRWLECECDPIGTGGSDASGGRATTDTTGGRTGSGGDAAGGSAGRGGAAGASGGSAEGGGAAGGPVAAPPEVVARQQARPEAVRERLESCPEGPPAARRGTVEPQVRPGAPAVRRLQALREGAIWVESPETLAVLPRRAARQVSWKASGAQRRAARPERRSGAVQASAISVAP